MVILKGNYNILHLSAALCYPMVYSYDVLRVQAMYSNKYTSLLVYCYHQKCFLLANASQLIHLSLSLCSYFLIFLFHSLLLCRSALVVACLLVFVPHHGGPYFRTSTNSITNQPDINKSDKWWSLSHLHVTTFLVLSAFVSYFNIMHHQTFMWSYFSSVSFSLKVQFHFSHHR